MTQPNRLAAGGRIDRSQPMAFTFDGKRYSGYAGDTLASALLANGVSIVGRSFKLHRPRGIVGAGPEEPNAIVQVGEGAGTVPNLRATEVMLHDGLTATSMRGWPNLRFDIGALNDAFGGLFAAGFYYKTFKRPRTWWPLYEHLIRKAAGFGRAPEVKDPDAYEHTNAHCDVLVVGGGPAGLAAAWAAAASGARVILADDQPEFGGSLLATPEKIDGQPAADWADKTIAELASLDDLTLLSRSTVFGYYDHNFLAISERCGERNPSGIRERLWRVRAKQVVLAQGAFERPIVFCNNDRPGVMLASAVSTYVRRYAVLPGKKAVVMTNNDAAYQAAIDLQEAGAEVAAIIDSRARGAGDIAQRAGHAGVPVIPGHIVTDVSGKSRVRRVNVARWHGRTTEKVQNSIRIDCDLVAMSGGYSPAVHLHSQAGGRNEWDDGQLCFVPGETTQENLSAGACNGTFALRDCLAEGLRAGAEAASRCGYENISRAVPVVEETQVNPTAALWRVPAEQPSARCPRQFVDFQNDTSVADILLAVREGYRNVEHVKRYTALGFGTDQGKLGNINGMAILAEALGKPIPEVGTTTFRPAYTPVTLGAGAGENTGPLYDPVRKTALHEWHEAAGAPMENVGQWHRPWYFPRAGEDIHAAVARECLAVRNGVGIMDASTLGKIDARGPDVVTFLERVYTHGVGRMKIGRCNYGILLGEDGMLMDDGVMARLAEQQFYLTTTTGGAATVLGWLERWLQTEWPELEVYLTSLTDHYSTIAVAGPDSRKVLEVLGCDISLEQEDFPFMSVRPAVLSNTPVQLFRVSFSGELAFEINIDSGYALDMWRALMAAGGPFGITPYGTETMHVLRAEKGYVIVGQDTDGSVSPVDLGMNWLLSNDKDFLGKRSLARPDCRRDDRKQLVGLQAADGRSVLPEGTQLINTTGDAAYRRLCGYVTSSYQSARLDQPIALALVEGGRSRKGETIFAALPDQQPLPVEIVSPVFYDRKGERQRA